MKISVVGLWHLGTVTASCIASADIHVIAYDPDSALIEEIYQGNLPVDEPGLQTLMQEKIKLGQLHLSAQLHDLVSSEIVWVTYDTPVDHDDSADTAYVIQKIEALFPYLKEDCVVLLSSQLPVGSIGIFEQKFQQYDSEKKVYFACSPENLRLGQALKAFMEPDRIIIGLSDESIKPKLTTLFGSLSPKIIWMKIASAEMTKHAINAFLATSVVFANEIATLCESTGADASEVEKGLKTELRIGPRAYLRPGSAFAGGTLARDVQFLIDLSDNYKFKTQLFPAILKSNSAHKKWLNLKISSQFDQIQGKIFCILGLTYKPDTDTLRRSAAIELCEWLHNKGASIIAYDPMLKKLPQEYAEFIDLKPTMNNLFNEVDAVVLTKNHAEFSTLSPQHFDDEVFIFDECSYMKDSFIGNDKINYFHLGKSS